MFPQSFFQMRDATLAARSRTGDKTISTDVKKGKFRVIRVTYDAKGKSTITPLHEGFITAEEAIAFLDGMA